MSSHPIVFFDGVCNFCDASVQFIIRRDAAGRIRFAAIQSETGQRLLKENGLDGARLDTMILLDDGKPYIKSSAALRIAEKLPWPWRLARWFCVVPRPIRDWFYDQVARRRYQWFGKKEACMVPNEEMRGRFLA